MTATAGVSINKFLAKMASFSEQTEWIDSDFTPGCDAVRGASRREGGRSRHRLCKETAD
ncbi:hypothetical protein [Nostoc sp. FACHB-888]|uniref:hypothetical protein n=1 Tax=Nostoc sp. FACHB-888 TaxID=2692842 RepID=UPI00321F97BD